MLKKKNLKVHAGFFVTSYQTFTIPNISLAYTYIIYVGGEQRTKSGIAEVIYSQMTIQFQNTGNSNTFEFIISKAMIIKFTSPNSLFFNFILKYMQ